MVATLVSDDFHVAFCVKSSVLPSVNIPVATYCWLVLFVEMDIVVVKGVTSIDSSTAGVTVSVALPEITPNVALIVVVPIPTDVANPWEPSELLIVDTSILEELQDADAVMSCFVLSENVPMAMNF